MSNIRISMFFIFLLFAPLSYAADELRLARDRQDLPEEKELSMPAQVALGVGIGCATVALRSAIANYIGSFYHSSSATFGAFYESHSDSFGAFLACHAANVVAVEAIRELATPLVCNVVAGKSKKDVNVNVVKNISRVVSGVALPDYHQVIRGCKGKMYRYKQQCARDAQIRRWRADGHYCLPEPKSRPYISSTSASQPRRSKGGHDKEPEGSFVAKAIMAWSALSIFRK